ARQRQMLLLNLCLPSSLSAKKSQYAYRDEANRKERSYELAVVCDWRKEYLETIGFAEGRKQTRARARLRVPGDTYHGVPANLSDLELLVSEKVRVIQSRRLEQQLWSVTKNARTGPEPTV